MKKNFIAIIKNILKNKNIPKYCFEIIEKDGSTCFLSTNYFDVINFEILNIFGYIGVKFEIITAYENGKLVETQIIVDDIELIKVEKFLIKEEEEGAYYDPLLSAECQIAKKVP